MTDIFSRTRILIGEENMIKLYRSRVAVFGIGGVGSFVCEALARAGVGNMVLFDGDVVSITNINRQIIALSDTVGKNKVDVMKERIEKINHDARIQSMCCFYSEQNSDEYEFKDYDYIVDAIDTIPCKIDIITRAVREGIPIISSMGTGNKINPLKLQIGDIYSTKYCPLARIMRRELKRHGVKKLKTVYSDEQPITPDLSYSIEDSGSKINKRNVPGSISFVPSTAGLLLASEVVKDIINK